MKEIPLTRGHVALIDDEDYERVSLYKWYARPNGKGSSIYAVSKKVGYLHRFIIGGPARTVDGNALNCSRKNLKAYDKNFKGVCFDKTHQVWKTYSTKTAGRKYFGDYKNLATALLMAQQAAESEGK